MLLARLFQHVGFKDMNRKLEINSKLHHALIVATENNRPFLLGGQPHRAVNYRRIDNTDFIAVEFKQFFIIK